MLAAVQRMFTAAAGGGGPVAFDASTDAQEVAGDGVLSLSHTSGGSDRGVFGTVAWHDGGGGAGSTSMTYGGSGMTEKWDIANPTNPSTQTAGYTLAGQATGAQTVTSTLVSAEPAWHMLGVISMTGVHQTVPVGTANTASGTASPATVTVADVGADGLVVDGMIVSVDGAVSPGANQTEVITEVVGTNPFRGSYQDGADGGVMSWTITGSDFWSTGAIEFKPA